MSFPKGPSSFSSSFKGSRTGSFNVTGSFNATQEQEEGGPMMLGQTGVAMAPLLGENAEVLMEEGRDGEAEKEGYLPPPQEGQSPKEVEGDKKESTSPGEKSLSSRCGSSDGREVFKTTSSTKFETWPHFFREKITEHREKVKRWWGLTTSQQMLTSAASRRTQWFNMLFTLTVLTVYADLVADGIIWSVGSWQGVLKDGLFFLVAIAARYLKPGHLLSDLALAVGIASHQFMWTYFFSHNFVDAGAGESLSLNQETWVIQIWCLTVLCALGVHTSVVGTHLVITILVEAAMHHDVTTLVIIGCGLVWIAGMIEYHIAQLLSFVNEQREAKEFLLDHATDGFCHVDTRKVLVNTVSPRLLEGVGSGWMGANLLDIVDEADRAAIQLLCDGARNNEKLKPLLVTMYPRASSPEAELMEVDAKLIPFATNNKILSFCVQQQGEMRTRGGQNNPSQSHVPHARGTLSDAAGPAASASEVAAHTAAAAAKDRETKHISKPPSRQDSLVSRDIKHMMDELYAQYPRPSSLLSASEDGGRSLLGYNRHRRHQASGRRSSHAMEDTHTVLTFDVSETTVADLPRMPRQAPGPVFEVGVQTQRCSKEDKAVETSIVWSQDGFSCKMCARPPLPPQLGKIGRTLDEGPADHPAEDREVLTAGRIAVLIEVGIDRSAAGDLDPQILAPEQAVAVNLFQGAATDNHGVQLSSEALRLFNLNVQNAWNQSIVALEIRVFTYEIVSCSERFQHVFHPQLSKDRFTDMMPEETKKQFRLSFGAKVNDFANADDAELRFDLGLIVLRPLAAQSAAYSTEFEAQMKVCIRDSLMDEEDMLAEVTLHDIIERRVTNSGAGSRKTSRSGSLTSSLGPSRSECVRVASSQATPRDSEQMMEESGSIRS
eukprot:CAMPEP_0178373148 /NCGR_PEP_ID=MMETSP0689_2-20121128/1715_1 /TAXON_ID=160604 /ORGANISM="Amphidinium massartii, Strain CS-259" /LENGTH=888 /DNA_ID=CAMNT_0019993085 /DNA_START=76 /DNA_END=2742 /DNA_ORIENTATION=-